MVVHKKIAASRWCALAFIFELLRRQESAFSTWRMKRLHACAKLGSFGRSSVQNLLRRRGRRLWSSGECKRHSVPREVGFTDMSLRVCNFNILAPSARLCSPFKKIPWQERQTSICDMLLQLEPDIVCLQEFEFSQDFEHFASLYEDKLAEKFAIHAKKRTGSKKEGLATLVRRDAFDDVVMESVELEPRFCDRVAIVAQMTHRASGRKLIVANTHLTVAHATNDHDIPMCRPLQMEQVLKLAGASPDGIQILCADMNSDHLETEPSGPYSAAEVNKPVDMAFDECFASALHEAHPKVRPISHTCSYAHDGCADYIFFKPNDLIELSSACLHPQDLPLDTQWTPDVGWGSDPAWTLSDHRPLIADFNIAVESQAKKPRTEE